MWRPIARRASLYRRAAAPGMRPAIHLRRAHHNEGVPLPTKALESASRFSFFSRSSHFRINPRLFTTSAQNHDDPPSEPFADEVSGGFDFGAPDAFDEISKLKFGNEGSIFDGAAGDIEMDQGSVENLEGSVAVDGNLDAGDESSGKVRGNDPEKVENLLAMLEGCGTGDGFLESRMEEMDLALDQELVLKVLQAPFVPGENLIAFFKWVLNKQEFKLSPVVLDSLASAVCTGIGIRERDAYDLWDLLKEIGEKKEKGIVSTESLNALLTGFSRLEKGKEAFDLFNKFEEFGCPLNADTYYLTLEALCKRSFYSWASLVCDKMLNADMLPDPKRVGKIISFFCKGGMAKDAHLVYVFAKDKKIHLSQSSIDFLIISLSRIVKASKRAGKKIDSELDRETVSLALEMLGDYSAEIRKRATKPFTSVIQKLCWIQDVGRAKKLLLEMVDLGPPPGNAVFNCVISGLAKSEDTDGALNMMRLMEKRGLKPDLYTYSAILSGFAKNGEMEHACKIFDEAKKNHSKLTPIVYHILIRGFCKLEQFDKAVGLLREMRAHGVNPNHDEYNKLIKSLCFKALDWETAERLEEEMRSNGVILNGRTRALIVATKELQEEASAEELTPA
ncbi:Pentatricopeptide repeat-containing protein -mitochondrial [Striga hermonthica]|uniref:Pentatricopeptide repeat-containing protein -mitochondrial n=1 Tax=Striga hermonthica TaxID=68872 RepID=A0A9N7N407_STRHE|nr:Pentatricopeptide repeat-containing protein -mitochondrial [Striga hermonthica]